LLCSSAGSDTLMLGDGRWKTGGSTPLQQRQACVNCRK